MQELKRYQIVQDLFMSFFGISIWIHIYWGRLKTNSKDKSSIRFLNICSWKSMLKYNIRAKDGWDWFIVNSIKQNNCLNPIIL
jgi:hypothetical protein